MRFLFLASLLLFGSTADCVFTQPVQVRQLCKEAQKLEANLSKMRISLQNINKREKMSLPAVVNIYEILSRYCTVLASIQRFSNLLIISKYQNRSDFIRCSIVIKSFADYFKTISLKLSLIIS